MRETTESLVPPAMAGLTATEAEGTPFVTAADVKPVEQAAIRPFRVEVAEEALTDLRRRIKATRLPEKETVADFSQGVQLDFIQALASYWATEYDWRKVEAKLNSYPNFLTEIDGLDIHFMHI